MLSFNFVALVLFSAVISQETLAVSSHRKQPNSTEIRDNAPLYKINLDADPKQRWNHVMADYKNLTQRAIQEYISSIPKELRFLASVAASNLDSMLPTEYGQEIKGIAEAVEAPLGDIVLLNVIYDVTAHCTGIIANDLHGKLWHGRNLDYGKKVAQTRVLEASTIRVDFVKNGRLLFSAVTFAGYVGLLTAWKPYQFALTVNERDKGNLERNLLSAAIELLKGRKLLPVSMVARQAFESDSDFNSASRRLMSTQLIAPVYYILSGNVTNQGIVIVRDQYSVLGVHALNSAAGRWFIVQTNYDPWVQPPASDDRRTPAIRAMRQLAVNRVNATAMLHVLSLNPVLNPHTAYTSIFSAAYPNQSLTVVRAGHL